MTEEDEYEADVDMEDEGQEGEAHAAAEVSDAGASNDDEVFQAYSTYDEAQKKLKDT